MERVFTVEIDLTDAEDLTDMDADHWDIIAAAAGRASVIILPDMSGVSDREIPVTDHSVITWK